MGVLRQAAEDLWNGVHSTRDAGHHPFHILNVIEPVSEHVAFYKGFSNLAAARTDNGLVLIDTGSYHPKAYQRSFDAVRSWNRDRIHTAIYTHGHVDHAYGLPPFLDEAREQNWEPPEIIGHENIRARMDRYIETEGYNAIINGRQFGHDMNWPTDPIYPTRVYRERLDLTIGGVEFVLHHGLGETDDHTFVFLPQERVRYTGDLFIWASPNAGNPQKVQRYVGEWAAALRTMERFHAEILLPGHGLPIFGAERVCEALSNTASYLESIYEQTVSLLNEGATIYELIDRVHPPADLSDKPYLQPIYDEPEFLVRTIYRLLAGWYSGIPSEMKPATPRAQAGEIVALAGGIEPLLARAGQLLESKDYRLASHLVDWAVHAEPDNSSAQQVRAEVYDARAKAELSTMSKGIYGAAAAASRDRAGA